MIEPRDTPLPEADNERRALAWHALLAWYAADGRAQLPWRHTRDPYAVLVSEVMLQQTQVERVLPKYRAFLGQFPTLADLAAAPVAEVIRAWAGLGYNMRAIRLHEIARQAVERYGGALPSSLDGLLTLKGIGRYTAGAVACFAFGLPVATVDTNIRRVLWRVFRGIEPATWPADTTFQRQILSLAEWALPRGTADAAYDWQQALMDLGATVCLARRPLCERCPLTGCCAAYQEAARVTLFPSGEAVARLRDERAAETRNDGQQTHKVAERRAGYTANTADKRRPPAKPFTSTSRYFRGRTVAILREIPSGTALSLAELGPRLKPEYTAADYPWLRTLVERLARDGLVRLVGDTADATAANVSLP
ncbi:MAG TPA: A/G-specific adenine glycosylase [Ktedonobacterales bacterium]|nr:A/G-specific adenine glycosylase [Ktedonobacterales bacterium]